MSDGELSGVIAGDDEGAREPELGRGAETTEGAGGESYLESLKNTLDDNGELSDHENQADTDDSASDDDPSSEDTEDGENTALEEPSEDIAPPSSWKPAAAEKWKDVPLEAKQEIARREKELMTNVSRFAQLAHDRQQKIAELEQKSGKVELSAPLREFFAEPLQQGKDVEHLLTGYANVVEKSKSIPGVAALIAEMAAMHGLSPAGLISRIDDLTESGAILPLGNRFSPPQRQQVPTELEQRLARLESTHSEGQKAQVAAQIETVIEQVRSEKDASGQLARPFFAELEPEIGPIYNALKAANPGATLPELLDRGYRIALESNPTVKRKVEALRKQRESQQRKQRVARANGLSVSNPSGASSVGTAPATNESYRDSLRATLRELGQ